MGNVETPGATTRDWHGIRKGSGQEHDDPQREGPMKVKSAYDEMPYQGHCGVTAMHEVAQQEWTAEDVLEAAESCGFPCQRHGGWVVEGIEGGFRMLDLIVEKTDHRTLSPQGLYGLLNPCAAYAPATTPTLAQFARANPQGAYYVIVRGHALVVRDGQVVDPNWDGRKALRRRVIVSYHVKNAGPGKYQPATQS